MNCQRFVIIAELWRFFWKTTPCGNCLNFVPKVYMATLIDVVVFKCRKICLTRIWWNRALFAWPKNQLPLKLSLLRGSSPNSARASPNMWLTLFQISAKWFTLGGVIAERVNTVFLPRRVFPIFARSEASLRANNDTAHTSSLAFYTVTIGESAARCPP